MIVIRLSFTLFIVLWFPLIVWLFELTCDLIPMISKSKYHFIIFGYKHLNWSVKEIQWKLHTWIMNWESFNIRLYIQLQEYKLMNKKQYLPCLLFSTSGTIFCTFSIACSSESTLWPILLTSKQKPMIMIISLTHVAVSK